MSKQFLTIDDQINRIKSRGISINNEAKIKSLLETHSFYNVYNGYRKPFLFLGQPDRFKNNTSFEEIFALYDFDRRLRNILFPVILDVENTLKTEIVYEFSKTKNQAGELTHDGDGYLRLSSYDVNGPEHSKKINYTLSLIGDLQRTLSKSFQKSESIDHYLLKYGYVPLWVLSTQISFGTVSKFFQCMKPGNRQSISKSYHMTDDDFLTILKLLTITRNHCAHYNRIYCFKSNIILPTPDASHYPEQFKYVSSIANKQGLFNVFIALKYFLVPRSYKALINSVDTLIKELDLKLKVINILDILAIMGFPADWKNIKN